MNTCANIVKVLFAGALVSCNPFSNSGPTSSEISQNTVPTSSYVECNEPAEQIVVRSRRMQRASVASREAAVVVVNEARGTRGSGTYVVHNGHHLVLTSGHVSEGPLPYVSVHTDSGESKYAVVAYEVLDAENDVAVLMLSAPIESRTPVRLRVREDYRSIVGEEVVYSGYPASHNLMTIYGTVAGIEQNNNIVMHSYAWMGASGSGVFDERGRLIGILRAVDVSRGPWGPSIVEDMVWVAPLNELNYDKIEKILEVIELINEVEEMSD